MQIIHYLNSYYNFFLKYLLQHINALQISPVWETNKYMPSCEENIPTIQSGIEEFFIRFISREDLHANNFNAFEGF